MNCPVCNRSLAPTLSICPSCGAMMFDSVREELQAKITSGRLTPAIALKQEPAQEYRPAPIFQRPAPPQPRMSAPAASSAAGVAVALAPQPVKRVETADLIAPKTSPTLVGFQSKNATLPDWRLQLQNAVQQRKGGRTEADPDEKATVKTQVPGNGSRASKPEIVRRVETIPQPQISDPRVANAVRRINESRNQFLETAKPKLTPSAALPATPYKFGVVAARPMSQPSPPRPVLAHKPRLVSSTPAPVKRDTNKLPPLELRPQIQENAKTGSDRDVETDISIAMPAEFSEIKRIRIRAEHQADDGIEKLEIEDDIEDLAHFSMRFGAGLFDLIIASFASLLILSPIAFTRGDWMTAAGLLTFVGVSSILLFLYMTICLGFYGKTMGMRLFSLELVDALENEYPTLHQAAVSSSVYIISLMFGGAGFLTVFFNLNWIIEVFVKS